MEEVKKLRLNSEKSLQHKTFKLKLGTTNKNNPLVVYVEGHAFICPQEEKDSYTKDISDFKYTLQRSIRNLLCNNDYLQKEYILDFQIANSGIKINKKSFLSFEFLMKQPKEKILKLNDVKKHTEAQIYEVVDTLEKKIRSHNFSLSKTKK